MPSPAVLRQPAPPADPPRCVPPVTTAVLAGFLTVVGLVLHLPATILLASLPVAAACACAEAWVRTRRRGAAGITRHALEVEAFETDVARRLARERAELGAIFGVEAPQPSTTSGAGMVVLGRGSVRSDLRLDQGDGPHEIELSDAPLAIRVGSGLEILGPQPLAHVLARSYARQLAAAGIVAGVSASARSEGVTVSVAERGRPPGPPDAEIWLGPDGSAFARSPIQARGQWVALDPQFSTTTPEPLPGDHGQPRSQAAEVSPAPSRMSPTGLPPPSTRSRVRSTTV
ncbi:MAG: hypothetical protein JWP75_3900 [Frondihabitans sp.]|nr:hypothetical protein [Frondihabitans sp.]